MARDCLGSRAPLLLLHALLFVQMSCSEPVAGVASGGWNMRHAWEEDAGGDATAAICHIFSRHASLLVAYGDSGDAVAELCSHMNAHKLSQTSAALLCCMLESVLRDSHSGSHESFLIATRLAAEAVAGMLGRHGAEGVGMAAGVVAAACAAADGRGNLVSALRILVPHLPQDCFLQDEGGPIQAVLKAAVMAPGAAQGILEGVSRLLPQADREAFVRATPSHLAQLQYCSHFLSATVAKLTYCHLDISGLVVPVAEIPIPVAKDSVSRHIISDHYRVRTEFSRSPHCTGHFNLVIDSALIHFQWFVI